MTAAYLHWTDADGRACHALWRSEAGVPPPRHVELVDDTTPAGTAYKLASAGVGLLWLGDFQNARHLLSAMTRRLDRHPEPHGAPSDARRDDTPAQAFHRHRQRQAHRARVLGMLLLPFEASHVIPLRRAPDVRQACAEAYGPPTEAYVASLRELLGLIGAHEWRKKGVAIPALQGRIHAHYGVFSPVRGEYVDLVAQAPLPDRVEQVFDIGTGTGVLAAVLARRLRCPITATDQDPRALACARDNLNRLQLARQVTLIQADLYPSGRADLIVCNPPWVPAQPASPIEHAVYDPDSRMLRGFLDGLTSHLTPDGEAWLIISDLAEHLGLRSRDTLLGWITQAGLAVHGRLDIRPRHPKSSDPGDPLHRARAAELTSLWRLRRAPETQ